MSVLEVSRLSKRFGNIAAVHDVSFSIEAAERVAVIGPNGAGKTTLFHLVSGELCPSGGAVTLRGRDITGAAPERVATAGLGRTFQRNSLLMDQPVQENVRLAVQRRMGIRFQMFRSVKRYTALQEETNEILEQVGLAERAEALPSELSYGEQRQLELGIALGTAPNVLLLDEPTAGMAASETRQMVEMLKALPDDIVVIVIEHDMEVVTALARRIIVMNFGKLIADGTAADVREDPEVLAAYLGGAPDGDGRDA